MSAVAEALRRIAVELREHPSHWTTAVGARDAHGTHVDCDSESATSWCTLGLIHRTLGGFSPDYHAAREALCSATNHELLGFWNDAPGRTADEVAHAFDKAADLAERP